MTPTPQEAASLCTAVYMRMSEQGVYEWEKGAALVSSPVGMRVVNFAAMADNLKFLSLIEAAVLDTPIETGPRRFTSDGGLVENNWLEKPNGQDFVEQISGSGRPDLPGWIRDILAPRIQAVFEDFSTRYNWGDPGQLKFSERFIAGDGGGRDSRGRFAPFEGSPPVKGFHGPDPRIVSVAKKVRQRQRHHPQATSRIRQSKPRARNVLVVGKENYDEYIDRGVTGGNSQAGSKPWFGQPIRQGLERAVARYEGNTRQVSPGGVSTPGSELRFSAKTGRQEPAGNLLNGVQGFEPGKPRGGAGGRAFADGSVSEADGQQRKLATPDGAQSVPGQSGPNPRLVTESPRSLLLFLQPPIYLMQSALGFR
jgi:hypothetical protein